MDTQTYTLANTATYPNMALNALTDKYIVWQQYANKICLRHKVKIKKILIMWKQILPVWSINKRKHTSVWCLASCKWTTLYCSFTPTAASLISSAHLNPNLTSVVSPSSSFSLILFTCCRRRSQYNLSSDILVFRASVFSWSSVIITANEQTFTIFYNRILT